MELGTLTRGDIVSDVDLELARILCWREAPSAWW
jgi:hypothetical protein